jgi:hypothetical protein
MSGANQCPSSSDEEAGVERHNDRGEIRRYSTHAHYHAVNPSRFATESAIAFQSHAIIATRTPIS